ncbi:glyoxalase, partial [Mycobacterium sp. ITM-2017-0098]
YRHVLGWVYDPATHMVTNTGQRIGIFSVPDRHTLFCCYAVADLNGARDSIVAGGGSVDEVVQVDFGAVLGATDPQGVEFAVYQP